MAKKIIILDRVNNQDEDNYRYVLWATVPDGLQSYYANNSFVSAYAGASNDEVTALRSGAVVEKVGTTRELSCSAGASFDTLASKLIQYFDGFQTLITGFNPNDKYGLYYNGTTWVVPTNT